MTTVRSLAFVGVLAVSVAAGAQSPAAPTGAEHSAHHPAGAGATTVPAARAAKMDTHMKAMREMHEKMSRARTPEERNALMAGHMKLMQEGMGMMGGMGGMGGMGPMGAASAPMDMATRHQMMEKRMDMMQSMMQAMVDRMGAAAAKP